MERLVTTSQAAQILGLSLQGVHYRIKNNQLKSIKKSGKTYVYISEYVEDKSNNNTQPQIVEIKEIIKAKDEQINLLKKNIKWMRKQYSSEINRLERNQKKIITVFNREIELLQSAFNEMRSIYKPQIVNNKDNQKQEAKSEIKENVKEVNYLSLQQFAKMMKAYGKNDLEIKTIILTAIKSQDSRFLYNKKTKKILIRDTDFRDFL
ncbi:DNA-binding protein [Malaciobacter molluscorum]|uniref:DNA-binding protein n=1 Tax=Malaciobacter molluscorum TaxID=1032072 RepID=UPI00100A90E5|nr:DNA-binding protein [Malaciobacter molluscorum]RXJ93608.1 DNA-binding protein [Malaciobacter molluscorum]